MNKKIRKKHCKLHMPEFCLLARIFLYLLSLVLIALSMMQVITGYFSAITGVFIYTVAMAGLVLSCYYLVVNLKRTIHEVIKPAIMANPFTRRIVTEYRLRTILFTVPGALSNIIIAIFNAAVGLNSYSAWFGTMAAYYILLSIMRINAVAQERKIRLIADENVRDREELKVYGRNSALVVFMAVVLGGAVILLEYSMGGKEYPGLTIYAVAAYTFYKIILSSVNLFKVRKQNSLLLAIIRRIGYIDACVSILLLQTAMFHSFATEQENFVKMMNGITGAIVSLMVLLLGIYGLYVTWKRKKREGNR